VTAQMCIASLLQSKMAIKKPPHDETRKGGGERDRLTSSPSIYE
jgi:hypothetical protein